METEKQLQIGLNNAYKKAGHNAYFGNGFKAGVEWAKANPIEPLVSLQQRNKDVDKAYLLGVLNCRGLINDKITELNRLKELDKAPHEILDEIQKSN